MAIQVVAALELAGKAKAVYDIAQKADSVLKNVKQSHEGMDGIVGRVSEGMVDHGKLFDAQLQGDENTNLAPGATLSERNFSDAVKEFLGGIVDDEPTQQTPSPEQDFSM